jgi:signal transduction histidine kinase
MVEDNGRGMGQPTPDGAGNLFGLQGIRERVDKLGGALHLDSRPGEGTLLSVAVPIRPARARPQETPTLDHSWRTIS